MSRSLHWCCFGAQLLKSRIDQGSYKVPRSQAPIDLWLDANEGVAVLQDTDLSGIELNRYPSRDGLEAELCKRLGLEVGQVLVTNGGDDAIDRVCRAYVGPGRNLIMTHPGFEMIATYARTSGGAVRSIEWWAGRFPIHEVMDSVDEETGVIALVSPNNPTGSVIQLDDLQTIASRFPDILIMLDLAYIEFADEDLQKNALALPNVVTIRTFSKAWGLAGIRVGYATASREIIGTLRAASGPYPTPSTSLRIAQYALDQEIVMQSSVERVQQERIELTHILESKGCKPMNSQGNFVMAKVSDHLAESGTWLRDGMSGFGIGIRAWPEKLQPADQRDWVRITCPSNSPNFLRLRHALETVLDPQALLFDLDGVLADVSLSYRSAILQTAAHFGLHLSNDDVHAFKARGNANNDWIVTHQLLAEGGVNVEFEHAKARFEDLYQGTSTIKGLWEEETLLISRDWVLDLKKSYQLAIVTGRPRKDAERFLRHFDLEDVFETLVCMEDGPAKPNPEPLNVAMRYLGVERAWMFGDTRDDLEAARSAQILPVGVVAPGHKDAEVLFAAGAAWVYDRITDVILPSKAHR